MEIGDTISGDGYTISWRKSSLSALMEIGLHAVMLEIFLGSLANCSRIAPEERLPIWTNWHELVYKYKAVDVSIIPIQEKPR